MFILCLLPNVMFIISGHQQESWVIKFTRQNLYAGYDTDFETWFILDIVKLYVVTV